MSRCSLKVWGSQTEAVAALCSGEESKQREREAEYHHLAFPVVWHWAAVTLQRELFSVGLEDPAATEHTWRDTQTSTHKYRNIALQSLTRRGKHTHTHAQVGRHVGTHTGTHRHTQTHTHTHTHIYTHCYLFSSTHITCLPTHTLKNTEDFQSIHKSLLCM